MYKAILSIALEKGVRAKIIIKKIEIIENHFHSGFSIEGISNFYKNRNIDAGTTFIEVLSLLHQIVMLYHLN